MKKYGIIEQIHIKDTDGFSHPNIHWRLNNDGSIELQQHRDLILITKEKVQELEFLFVMLNSEQAPERSVANTLNQGTKPLSPNNPSEEEEITECYVPVEIKEGCELPKTEGGLMAISKDPNTLGLWYHLEKGINNFKNSETGEFDFSHWLKKIILPSPAVIQETKKLKCYCNSLAEKEFCQSYNYGKNGECAKDLGIDVYNLKNKI